MFLSFFIASFISNPPISFPKHTHPSTFSLANNSTRGKSPTSSTIFSLTILVFLLCLSIGVSTI